MNNHILPQTNPNSVAFQFGVRDAQAGEPCVPEMIFLARQQQVEYAAGWESVKGVTLTTAQFTRSPLPKPVIVPNLKINDEERVRRTDGNIERVFHANAARDRRIEAMRATTAAFMGTDTGDILFA